LASYAPAGNRSGELRWRRQDGWNGNALRRLPPGSFMKNVVCICAFLLSSAAVANEDCSWPAAAVSATAGFLAPEVALEVSTKLTTRQILERLGPAARDVGSGLHVLEWDLTDGRILHVSTQGACSRPMATGLRKRSTSRGMLQDDAAGASPARWKALAS
jgi:hypothetical protein